MSEFFGSVWWLIVTLGVLITFHEYGHFVVARRCGVRVLKFSIGFGKALWSRFDRHGTQYVIAAIPLGGYVKMLDEREGDVAPEHAAQAHNRQPVWARIAISAAGPLFNLVFAIVAFWAVLVIGKADYQPTIATPTGLAAASGFAVGDTLLSVGDARVSTWTDAINALVRQTLDGSPTRVRVRTADGTETTRLLPLDRLADRDNLEKAVPEIGLTLKPPRVAPIVEKVRAGMPAAAAGLKDGDRIVAVNGTPIDEWATLADSIQKEAAKSPTLAFTVERAGARQDFTVQAIHQESDPTRWVTGIEGPDAHDAVLRLGPIAAIPAALAETWQQARDMLKLLGGILTGQASVKNIGGVISIGQAANATAQMGVAWFLSFLGAISLTLAVMNLLPIPILDGGHLLYYLIELVKGSPVSERAQIAGQYVGLVLLVALMGLAFYNDILRIAS